MVLIDNPKEESSMETCVLLPEEFSLKIEKSPAPFHNSPYSLLGNFLPSFLPPVTPHVTGAPGEERGTGDPASVAGRSSSYLFHNYVRVCASKCISARTQFLPFSGTVRTDNLPFLPFLPTLDVRHRIGCYDEIVERSGKKLRLCNWVRFVRYSLNFDQEVNMVATRNAGSVLFEVVREIPEGSDLVVFPMAETNAPGDPFSLSAFALLRSSLYRQTLDSIMADTPLDLSRSLLSSTSNSTSGKEDDISKGSKEKFSPFLLSEGILSAKDKAETASCSEPSYQKLYASENVSHVNHGSFFPPFFSPNPALHRYFPFSLPPPPPSFISTPFSLPSVSPNISETIHTISKPHPPEYMTPSSSNLLKRESPSLNLGPVQPKRRERTMLPCSECGKAFDRPSLLKRHMRTHTGEKPHVCDVCGKGFSTSSSLNTHRRIHSGEKPHQCGVCGKRFTASSNLYYHKMTHVKEKPHKCSLCTRSFPTPGDLRSHMFVHNGQWPHKCAICGKGFSKLTNLKNHAILHSERQSKRMFSPSSPEGRSNTPTSSHTSASSSSTNALTSASPTSTSLPSPLFSGNSTPALFIPPSPPISPPAPRNPEAKVNTIDTKEKGIEVDSTNGETNHSDPPSRSSPSSASEDEQPIIAMPNAGLKFPFSSAPAFFSLMSSPFFSFPQSVVDLQKEGISQEYPVLTKHFVSEDDMESSTNKHLRNSPKQGSDDSTEDIEVVSSPKDPKDLVCDLTLKSVERTDILTKTPEQPVTVTLPAEIKES